MGTFHSAAAHQRAFPPPPSPPASPAAGLACTRSPPRQEGTAKAPRASGKRQQRGTRAARGSGRAEGQGASPGGRQSSARLGTAFPLPAGTFCSVGDAEGRSQQQLPAGPGERGGMLWFSCWDTKNPVSPAAGPRHCCPHPRPSRGGPPDSRGPKPLPCAPGQPRPGRAPRPAGSRARAPACPPPLPGTRPTRGFHGERRRTPAGRAPPRARPCRGRAYRGAPPPRALGSGLCRPHGTGAPGSVGIAAPHARGTEQPAGSGGHGAGPKRAVVTRRPPPPPAGGHVGGAAW